MLAVHLTFKEFVVRSDGHTMRYYGLKSRHIERYCSIREVLRSDAVGA